MGQPGTTNPRFRRLSKHFCTICRNPFIFNRLRTTPEHVVTYAKRENHGKSRTICALQSDHLAFSGGRSPLRSPKDGEFPSNPTKTRRWFQQPQGKHDYTKISRKTRGGQRFIFDVNNHADKMAASFRHR